MLFVAEGKGSLSGPNNAHTRAAHHLYNVVRDTQRGCAYRPWPRCGDDVVVASERWVLKYLFDHVYGIDAHGCGVPEREGSSPVILLSFKSWWRPNKRSLNIRAACFFSRRQKHRKKRWAFRFYTHITAACWWHREAELSHQLLVNRA